MTQVYCDFSTMMSNSGFVSVGGGDNVHANSPLTAGYWEGCDTAAPRPHINQAHEDGAMLIMFFFR